jgi:MtrB/PioB family decaheme-associated outer membrane protein
VWPATAGAQLTTSSSSSASSGQPATGAQPTQPAAATPAVDESRSLFEQTWNQFQFGGRLSSISGDPARWQRYQDFRDGVVFTDAKYAREHADGNWSFKATADNVGYRDQRYFASYERPGRFAVSGFWDEIPQFYSVDTKTPFTESGEALVLDDATQRAIETAQPGASLSSYIPQAAQFDLHERRDVGHVNFVATPTPQLDVTASYTMNRHVGELPWGASFGFSNDVEVALPYDSRANDFTLGTEWTNNRSMVRVAYNGSWFDNLDPILVWDSPLDLTDRLDNPGRGRMTLWPSNSAQTVSAAGYHKFARHTQLTGFLSFGTWSNDEPLQPFTINSGLPQFALPRANTDGQANVFSTNLAFVSHPVDYWRFSARLRRYDYNNETPAAVITDYVSYDDQPGTSPIGGPRLYAHDRTTFDADATFSGFTLMGVNVGYTHNSGGYDFRVFDSTGEDVFRLAADAVGNQWMTFRAEYEYADRGGSGLNEDLLVQTGEQPAMRHYDVANRTRNKFTGQFDVTPTEAWMFSVSAGVGQDDFDDSYFGLQESSFRTFSLAADYRHPNGFGGGGSYNYERYTGLHTSRSAGDAPQPNDPLRDWTTDSKERVNYFSIYAMPPRFGRNTEARVSYDFSHAKGNYLYTVAPGGPLPAPSQLPEVFNKLQQFHLDVRHRLTNRLVGSFSYLYEPFDVYDFAFDQTVVNSIVQPSSLVLGYVYRPYTAHSAMFAIRYFW